MVRPLFDTHSTTVTIGVAGVYVRALGGSPRRISLAVSMNGPTNLRVANNGVDATNPGFANLRSDQANVLAYRDFGQLIQGEIFIESLAGTGSVNVIETFYTR